MNTPNQCPCITVTLVTADDCSGTGEVRLLESGGIEHSKMKWDRESGRETRSAELRFGDETLSLTGDQWRDLEDRLGGSFWEAVLVQKATLSAALQAGDSIVITMPSADGAPDGWAARLQERGVNVTWRPEAAFGRTTYCIKKRGEHVFLTQDPHRAWKTTVPAGGPPSASLLADLMETGAIIAVRRVSAKEGERRAAPARPRAR